MAYPYLFTYVDGESWRTQKEVRAALERSFRDAPDGLPGNDDAGATSAWYVFGALGFHSLFQPDDAILAHERILPWPSREGPSGN